MFRELIASATYGERIIEIVEYFALAIEILAVLIIVVGIFVALGRYSYRGLLRHDDEERYRELKATKTFRDLQAQLEGTENRIAVERRRFNDATMNYNKTRRRFPTVLLASIMGFGDKPYFKASEGAEEPPKVEF